MAISNYGELKSKLSRYLFNQRFLPDYDDYTTMFETDANARLRVLPMETSVSLTTVNGIVALPTDYLLWRTIRQTSLLDDDEPDYVHPAYLPTTAFNHSPAAFTIEGGNIITRPINDAAGEWDFHYYQKIPTIVGSNGNSNWLLTEWPNAYLFGLMTEAAGHGRNLEMAQLYKARRDEVFAQIIQRYALTTGATSPNARTAEFF